MATASCRVAHVREHHEPGSRRLMETEWARCVDLLAAGEVRIEIRGRESVI